MNQAGVADIGHAVEIAERVWWVGHYLEGDPFQCHAYLIEHGDQSMLIDPGSALTFPGTLAKIEEVVPFSSIRDFICHHQDPDITASLPQIDAMVEREDARLITDWRAAALLKHYDLQKLRFWEVEKHHWSMEMAGRKLSFIFTPYMHFPGAFCTFDHQSGILFSSDIFGGFTEQWELFASDESYFAAMRPFHEHYMPSQEIVTHGMQMIEAFPVRMIAPQHGSIIPEHLVSFMVSKLKTLECGLYLISKQDIDVRRLMKLNRFARKMTQSILSYRDFKQLAEHFLQSAREVLPVTSLSFYLREKQHMIYLGEENLYHGESIEPDALHMSFFAMDRDSDTFYQYRQLDDGTSLLILLLESHGSAVEQAVAVFALQDSELRVDDEFVAILRRLISPLSVAVEREAMFRQMERDRNKFFERSIRDALTGLYTRHYMHDVVGRMLAAHARNARDCVGLVMFDVDYFKKVNDRYGHQTGDEVLQAVGHAIREESRSVDVPVRFGGEEFALFLAGCSLQDVCRHAERVRRRVSAIDFHAGADEFHVTLSAGVAMHRQGEPLLAFMNRADKALYQAKESGRNRVCVAADDGKAVALSE